MGKKRLFSIGRRGGAASPSAFTLIELLIVVAIIAILAAIAVPNFLEAQARAKISRAYADMRTIGVGIQTYTVDNNRPPVGSKEDNEPPAIIPAEWKKIKKGNARWRLLTSPVAYLNSIPIDPFGLRVKRDGSLGALDPRYGFNNAVWKYYVGSEVEAPKNFRLAKASGAHWWLNSRGPSRHNRVEENIGNNILRALLKHPSKGTSLRYPDVFYDATNGTKSYGRIVFTNRGVEPAGG